MEEPFRLEPAASVHPRYWPRIPAWWPPAERAAGDPAPPRTPEERDVERRERAHREARTGPRDGLRGMVQVGKDGPPALYEGDPGYRYTLATRKGGVLIYRYDPAASPQHAASMRAVEEAFAQVGAEQAVRMLREGVAS